MAEIAPVISIFAVLINVPDTLGVSKRTDEMARELILVNVAARRPPAMDVVERESVFTLATRATPPVLNVPAVTIFVDRLLIVSVLVIKLPVDKLIIYTELIFTKLVKIRDVDNVLVLMESVINCAVVPANCAVDRLFVLNSPVLIFLVINNPVDMFVTVRD